jgi:hypothetical protein
MSDSDQKSTPPISNTVQDYDPFLRGPWEGLFDPFKNVRQFSAVKPMTSFTSFDPKQINLLMASGYRAYLKMNGVHARISLRSSERAPVIMVAQNAKDCTDKLSGKIKADLLRMFPSTGKTNIKGFYAIKSSHLYLFDVTQVDGKMLMLPFPERWQRLPRIHGSRNITRSYLIPGTPV